MTFVQITEPSALRSFVYVVESSSGSRRVSPTVVMKFVSPVQRGSEMHMQMIGDAGAGGAAQIHPQIEAVRMVDVVERRLHALREQHHFRRGVPFQPGKIRGVRVGNDHHVARLCTDSGSG